MTTLTKLDLKADLKHLYSPSAKQPQIVDVPPLNFLMIDGSGDPNTQSLQDAMQALYTTAFTLKFAFKKTRGIDYPVMRSEGLWWMEKPGDFLLEDPANWLWTLMMVLPEVVTPKDVSEAVTEAQAKQNLPALKRIRFATFHEGLCAQILHVGSYDMELPTIERLKRFITEQGYAESGKHHEIYLSDPNRTAPEKLKTIIRYPILRR
jgi:hypothetical protein